MLRRAGPVAVVSDHVDLSRHGAQNTGVLVLDAQFEGLDGVGHVLSIYPVPRLQAWAVYRCAVRAIPPLRERPGFSRNTW